MILDEKLKLRRSDLFENISLNYLQLDAFLRVFANPQ